MTNATVSSILLSIVSFFKYISLNQETLHLIPSILVLLKIAQILMASTSSTRPIFRLLAWSSTLMMTVSPSVRVVPIWPSLICYVVLATTSTSVVPIKMVIRKMSLGWRWGNAPLLVQQWIEDQDIVIFFIEVQQFPLRRHHHEQCQ